jgi:hypothetical protein
MPETTDSVDIVGQGSLGETRRRGVGGQEVRICCFLATGDEASGSSLGWSGAEDGGGPVVGRRRAELGLERDGRGFKMMRMDSNNAFRSQSF